MANLWRLCRRICSSYFYSLYLAMRNERRATQKRMMEHDPLACLLDCGCREGHNTRELAERVGAQHVIGLDLNIDALRQSSQRDIAPVRANLNFSIPLASERVDVIVASDVLEHLVDPATFVAEMYRVLRPGGYVMLDTPNLASWHNVFALMLGMQPFSGPNVTTMQDGDMDLIREMHRATLGLVVDGVDQASAGRELTRHIVVLAYGALLRVLRDAGFRIEVCRGFGYYPLPPFLARVFQRLDPRHSHHILVKARKKREMDGAEAAAA
jgi:SAM-dependent methyltransferase